LRPCGDAGDDGGAVDTDESVFFLRNLILLPK
jgi:hypothetical protein